MNALRINLMKFSVTYTKKTEKLHLETTNEEKRKIILQYWMFSKLIILPGIVIVFHVLHTNFYHRFLVLT